MMFSFNLAFKSCPDNIKIGSSLLVICQLADHESFIGISFVSTKVFIETK
ncbi:hypothetical protein [Sphingobacterium sp. xlx-130]|nr:hypothetical protein [Sphingobacterium sp. xlx-130]